MTTSFNRGDKVKLKSFHNTLQAPKDIDSTDNYWQLIGSVGEIVKDEKKTHPYYLDMGERVLVKFENLEKYGLHCHNEAPNSLWIFLSDLEKIQRD